MPALSAADWTLDPGVRHLNHGSFGAVPRLVQQHQQRLRDEMETDPDAWFQVLPERLAAARADVAAFLRVPATRLALVPNASAAVSTVLGGVEGLLGPGREILLTDHAYGAVRMAAERAAARTGAVVRTVELPLDADEERATELVDAQLSPRTALLVVDQITSPTARLLPVAALVARAHRHGARVLVDGAHAPGMLADPVGAAGADYWVGNLHKWPCTPRGTAALVVAEGADGPAPLIDSWNSAEPYPLPFDMQGTGDFTAWLAAPHSLRLIGEQVGWDEARARITALADRAQRIVAEALGTDPGPVSVDRAPAMRLVELPPGAVDGPDGVLDLKRRLVEEAKSHVAVVEWNGRGFLRLSAHLYNEEEEYRALAGHLPGLLRGR